MNSIWSKTCELLPRDSLPGDTSAEVAVIGAGMAGILIAAALQEQGCRVIVLEAERIAGGQTRNTTAKITSQHGFAYQRRNYIGTQTLPVAYDGIKGFLAQIVNEEHSVVYAAQLFEHPVHGVE